MTRFSVIIPVFNQASFIGDAISSVLSQTFSDWELIVVDDGSTDDSGRRAWTFEDRRVRVIPQSHAGVMAARKRGLDASRGDAVLFVDGDDRLRPEALARFARAFDADASAGVVYGDRILIDETGRPLGGPRRALLNPRPTGDVLTRILTRPFMSTPSQACIRRSAIERIESWPFDLPRSADWVMFAQLAASARFLYVKGRPVVEYRMRRGSMARQLARAATADLQIREVRPALDAIFSSPAIVRRLSETTRAALRRRADASALALTGQELLRIRDWNLARAHFLAAIRLGSRDARDFLCLVLALARVLPPGTRAWTGAFDAADRRQPTVISSPSDLRSRTDDSW